MFCADYIAAFVYHAIITVGTIKFVNEYCERNVKCSSPENVNSDSKRDIDRKRLKLIAHELAANGLGLQLIPNKIAELPSTKDKKYLKVQKQKNNSEMSESVQNINDHKTQNLLIPLCIGLVSGITASTTLYPFDFVRSGVLKPGLKRLMSAGSTVPYAGALFGVYFSFRDPNNTASQLSWAAGASSCAILAEVPFDHAKRAMFGSYKMMLGAGFLYVPFASLMLVMYDKAAINIVTPFL